MEDNFHDKALFALMLVLLYILSWQTSEYNKIKKQIVKYEESYSISKQAYDYALMLQNRRVMIRFIVPIESFTQDSIVVKLCAKKDSVAFSSMTGGH